MTTSDIAIKPWYKEFWPWFLMAGPFIVVLAAFYTAWLAMSSGDGLVNEDPYKRGLAISETLDQNAKASSLGLRAGVTLVAGSVRVRLDATAADFLPPPSIRFTLSHPTRAGVDQIRQLSRVAGAYVGELNLPSSGHWLILIEDGEKSWRLLAGVQLPSAGEIVIGGETPADIRN